MTKSPPIDGQKRSATLLVLLASVRDRARNLADERPAGRIQLPSFGAGCVHRARRRAFPLRRAPPRHWEVSHLTRLHADPHPANVFVEPGGALVLVDFGSCGRVTSLIRTTTRRISKDLARLDVAEEPGVLLDGSPEGPTVYPPDPWVGGTVREVVAMTGSEDEWASPMRQDRGRENRGGSDRADDARVEAGSRIRGRGDVRWGIRSNPSSTRQPSRSSPPPQGLANRRIRHSFSRSYSRLVTARA